MKKANIGIFYSQDPNFMATADVIRLVEIAVHLRRSGFNVTILGPRDFGISNPYIANNDVKVQSISSDLGSFDLIVGFLQESTHYLPKTLKVPIIFDFHQVITEESALFAKKEDLLRWRQWQDDAISRASAISTTGPDHPAVLAGMYPDLPDTVQVIPCGAPEHEPSGAHSNHVRSDFPVIFAGSFHQPQYAEFLNRLGELLINDGSLLYAIGAGSTGRLLDDRYVAYMGAADHHACHDFMAHMKAGIAIPHMGHMPYRVESTKIWAYLRYGVPTVGHEAFWNTDIIEKLSFGQVVSETTPEKYHEALRVIRDGLPDLEKRASAVTARMLKDHSWTARAASYESLIKSALD